MASIRGHIDYGTHKSPRAPGSRSFAVVRSDNDGERKWCPHCGGWLSHVPPMLAHPCFDDEAHKISGHHATRSEWRILCALRSAFRHILTREFLFGALESQARSDSSWKLVDVRICSLRRKLTQTPFAIETVWGRGFMLTDKKDSPV